MFTDGVVERRRQSIDDGIANLSALLARNADAPVQTLIDHIVGDLCGDAGDDCCLLILRRSPSPSSR